MIYVFGDSYSELSTRSRENYVTWPKLLNSNFKVRNYSKSGTGPQFSFRRFFNCYNNFTKDDIIIFILSSPDRDEIIESNLKNLEFLNSLHNVKKTIVFYSFSDDELKNYNYQNDEKFYFYNQPLENISNKELYYDDYIEKINEGSKGRDLRANHLSKLNHLIFFEMLKDIIYNDVKEYKFFEHFRSLEETYVKSQFIYE